MVTNRIIVVLTVWHVSVVAWIAEPAAACYTVVVGRAASADGSVLVGHNEVWGSGIVNFRALPRIRHKPGDVVRMENGRTVPEVEETYRFLWSENPGKFASDTHLNEWGVGIIGDVTSSRPEMKVPESQAGGMHYMLRRLVVQRARSAREGVQIAGDLIAKYGFGSGWTLIIADSKEAWVLSLTAGSVWVAQRVPDDQVVLLPNQYIVTEVRPEDTANFMTSPNLIDYAKERGWYDPRSGAKFDFRKAYDRSNYSPFDLRQWRGQCLVTGQNLPQGQQMPFSVVPLHKLSLKDVMNILRDRAPGLICSDGTMEASIFQLRADLPPDVGCVYWRTPLVPDLGAFVPWYAGVTNVPRCYYKLADLQQHLNVESHFRPSPDTYQPDPEFSWWAFKEFQDIFRKAAGRRRAIVRELLDAFEAKAMAAQPDVDAKFLSLSKDNPDAARDYLTQYSGDLGLKALRLSKGLTARLQAELKLPATTEPSGLDRRP